MILFDPQGWAVEKAIRVDRYPGLRHGDLTAIHGIIVHQTGASTTASTLAQYRQAGSNGAHFLIEKEGAIIQTASVLWKVQHVGPLRARCLAEHSCSPVEAKTILHLGIKLGSVHELAKSTPSRYPANKDAIGIEIVGGTTTTQADGYIGYEHVTAKQNASLRWLVEGLRQSFKVPVNEVFRHPEVSRKDPHEAESASW